MRSKHFAFAIVCVLVPQFGVAQETTDKKADEVMPAINVSYDNWWFGTREFSFYPDGSFTFALHCKRFDSQVNGTGKLPPERIEQLLSTLDEKGFFGVSEESIESKITQDGGRKVRRTDQTTYRIVVHGAKLRNQIKYYDVYGDAETFPNVADLQHLKDSVDEIKRFLSRAASIE
ncbi:MAG: hypothetical protein H6822_35015 [Planctomycetaceae bacterium]|nr:hypothetical protein [Planctomycetales bacterium]MCB9927398.1 hypothetical protein [Planctomycetaceae bacterium]